MRTFITGEFGRPTAIEVNSWRFSPHHIVEHYPNVDCWDPLSGQDRVPVGRVRNDCPTLEALYEGQNAAIQKFRPSLLVTCFLDDARVANMADRFGSWTPTFCVSQEASRLESDRQYARDVCDKCGVSATRLEKFHSANGAIRALAAGRFFPGAVIKFAGARANTADGLGNLWAQIAHSAEEAIEVVRQWPVHAYPIAVEEYVSGIEVAFSALVDAERDLIVPMVTDFEYTRLCTGDIGPETSEMGCQSSVMNTGPTLNPEYNELLPGGLLPAACPNPSARTAAATSWESRSSTMAACGSASTAAKQRTTPSSASAPFRISSGSRWGSARDHVDHERASVAMNERQRRALRTTKVRWLQSVARTSLLDPTRWAFGTGRPVLYLGKADYYDDGLVASSRLCYQFKSYDWRKILVSEALRDLPSDLADALWAGDVDRLSELAPCRCCCFEHTFESCEARLWFGCRGQGALTRAEEESWRRHYEQFHGMTAAEFYGFDAADERSEALSPRRRKREARHDG